MQPMQSLCVFEHPPSLPNFCWFMELPIIPFTFLKKSYNCRICPYTVGFHPRTHCPQGNILHGWSEDSKRCLEQLTMHLRLFWTLQCPRWFLYSSPFKAVIKGPCQMPGQLYSTCTHTVEAILPGAGRRRAPLRALRCLSVPCYTRGSGESVSWADGPEIDLHISPFSG